MTHYEGPVTDLAAVDVAHLESCESCRDLVSVDVDLDGVRTRVLADVPVSSAAPVATRTRKGPWIAGAAAAAAVVAVFVPLFLLSGDPSTDVGGGIEPDMTQPPPPSPPVVEPGSSFEIIFEGTGDIEGRLIWASDSFYEGMRSTQTSDGGVFDYSFFRSADGRGFNDRSYDPFPKGADGFPDMEALPVDPVIPWSVLLTALSPDEMWVELVGSADPVAASPTHPLAVGAFANDGWRLEWSSGGVPVLAEGPAGRFSVTELIHRELMAGEVGNNVDLPFDYAIYLAPDARPEQADVLASGIVSFGDYEAAAIEAAECAGVSTQFDSGLGLFRFDPTPALTTPDLAECRDRFLDDIEAVWRVQSKWISEDEFTLLWYTIEGQLDQAAIYQAEPGPIMTLGEGAGWTMTIRERGPGFCYSLTFDMSATMGCQTVDGMQLSGLLEPLIGTTLDSENELADVEIGGLVAESIDKIVINFESGHSEEIAPGAVALFGVRAFGFPFVNVDWGQPTTLEVYSGNELLGAFSHELGR